jgi:purine nucleoside permease
MVAGVAGLNPEIAATGSITFARYAVQVGLQYEFDIRDIPDNYTTGYIPQGSVEPNDYPQELYGSEVFEVNVNLRDLAISLATTAALSDSAVAQTYRAQYAASTAFTAGSKSPSVVACDTAPRTSIGVERTLGKPSRIPTSSGRMVPVSTAQCNKKTTPFLKPSCVPTSRT